MAVNSFVFDEQFYLSQNPDVASAVSRGLFTSGQDHYQQFGRFEARDPNALFDTSFYLSQYPDVAAAGVNPFQHFQMLGADEGRFFNGNIASIDSDGDTLADEFDSAAYLAANPDVAAAVGPNATFQTAYEHYVKFGQFEGRTAQTTSGEALSGPFFTGGGAGGNTFTLTTGQDVASANTFNAPVVTEFGQQGLETINSSDILTGQGDNPTLNLEVNNRGAGAIGRIAPTLTNIQTLNYRDIGASGFVFDLLNATGVQTVNVLDSVGTPSIDNLELLDETSITVGNSGATDITFTADSTAGDDDSVDLTLSDQRANVSLQADDLGAIEAVNITSTNSSDLIPNQGGVIVDGATTFNIDGDSALALGTVQDTLDTIDASGLSAALTVDVSDAVEENDLAFTGGSGDDFVTIGSELDGDDSIDGGDGDDTVVFESLAGDFFADDADDINVTNVETARFNVAGTASIDFDDFADDSDFQNIVFNTVAAGIPNLTVENFEEYSEFTLQNTDDGVGGAGEFGVVTVDYDDDFDGDTVTVNLINNDENARLQVGTLDISNDDADDLDTIVLNTGFGVDANEGIVIGTVATTDTDGDIDTLELTGDADLTIFNVGADITDVDASDYTGDLTITFASDVEFQGGSGDDVITSASGNAVIDGGAGDDTLISSGGIDVLRGGEGLDIFGAGDDTEMTGGAGSDEFHFNVGDTANVITDFTRGQDVISFDDGTGAGEVNFANSETNGTRGTSDLDEDDYVTLDQASAADQITAFTTANSAGGGDGNSQVFEFNAALTQAQIGGINYTGDEAYFLVFNSDENVAEIYYDAGDGATSDPALVTTLQGVSSLAQTVAFSANDFDVY